MNEIIRTAPTTHRPLDQILRERGATAAQLASAQTKLDNLDKELHDLARAANAALSEITK